MSALPPFFSACQKWFKTRSQRWLFISSFLILGSIGVTYCWQSVAAQGMSLDQYPSNAGTDVGLDSSSTNFKLDSVLDFVGGDSSPSGQNSGLNVMHGYHFLADEEVVAITQITAVPERRQPRLNNNAVYFKLEILPANTTYDPSLVIWSNAGYANHLNQTAADGIWRGDYQLDDLEPGDYDIYLTGLSHLRKKLTAVPLIAGENQLAFTFDQAALDSMLTAGTIDQTHPQYALLTGDAAAIADPDGSCLGDPATCPLNAGFSYTGDEWGDNQINSVDIGALTRRLFAQSPADDILKEDLDVDTQINSLDLGLTTTNLFKEGEI